MRNVRAPALAALVAATLAACAGPRAAPPPPMGDLSGPWLLETDGRPVRFVGADGDTISLTVAREPLLLRQGAAVSDTSIAVEIAGLRVAGAMEVTKGIHGSHDAELVTGGAAAGRLTFLAPVLTFTGRWSDDAFTGEFQVDPERAGKHARLLDEPRAWTLRRMASGPR